MLPKLLVVYASKYGSTREVADVIASKVREQGYVVDLRSTAEVKGIDLHEYAAVVLGAPIYMNNWLSEAHDFMETYKPTLSKRPLAIFSLGPVDDSPENMQIAKDGLTNALERYGWLNPVEITMFVGKYDPAKLGPMHKLIAILPASPLHDLPATDHRDWAVIHQWARALPEKLGLTVSDSATPT